MKKILFIGNSHTYYNSMPAIVRDLFASVGEKVDCVMLTEGGKGLEYHSGRKDTAFNILHGGYDYVVLQDKATKFNAEEFEAGGMKIYSDYISRTESKPVLYLVWSNRDKPQEQAPMTAAYLSLASRTGAAVAPAGEIWRRVERCRPAPVLYRDDGNHATPTGSYLAASAIFYAITRRERAIRITEGGEPHTRLGIDTKTAAVIQRTAAHITHEINNPHGGDAR